MSTVGEVLFITETETSSHCHRVKRQKTQRNLSLLCENEISHKRLEKSRALSRFFHFKQNYKYPLNCYLCVTLIVTPCVTVCCSASRARFHCKRWWKYSLFVLLIFFYFFPRSSAKKSKKLIEQKIMETSTNARNGNEPLFVCMT